MSNDSLAHNLDIAARHAGQRWVVIVLAGEAFQITVPGTEGAVVLDGASSDLFVHLEKEEVFAPSTIEQTLLQARAAAMRGVELRSEGDLEAAYIHQRFAAFAAVRSGQEQGVAATSANVWAIYQAIRYITVRALGPSRNPAATADQQQDFARYEASLRWTADAIASDSALIATTLRTGLPNIGSHEHLPSWAALRRYARMGKNEGLRHEAIAELRMAADKGNATALMLAVTEDMADIDLLEALGTNFTADAKDNSTPSSSSLYSQFRPQIMVTDDLLELSIALHVAFDHLAFLRLQATTAGGAFGHRLSYAISALLQQVGRDLCSVLLHGGETEPALRYAEAMLARSMVDWMGRTHGLWSLSPRFRAAINPLTGSVNGVEAAGLQEISMAASNFGPIVYYLRHQNGYAAWLVRKDGQILFTPLGDVTEQVVAVSSQFPFLQGRDVSRHIGNVAAAPGTARTRDAALCKLYEALFPSALRQALAGEGQQLVIIADPSLNAVPFCALKNENGRYLVEDHDIEVWPSVTARLVLESGARISNSLRARRTGPVLPLVIGIGEFDGAAKTLSAEAGQVQLPALPGAADEARLVAGMLGTSAVLNHKATEECLFKAGQGAEIVHLATHGFADESSPEDSFLVLSDATVTARQLYQFDQGIRCGLVVMSACRTGLGGANPDSIIGISNAFLISGAQCVLSTLWTISDLATVGIMQSFYRNMLDETSISRALAKAQREALASPPTSDPYFWGAFRITGRGSQRIGATNRSLS